MIGRGCHIPFLTVTVTSRLDRRQRRSGGAGTGTLSVATRPNLVTTADTSKMPVAGKIVIEGSFATATFEVLGLKVSAS